jgi:hypothetical protein
MWKSRVNLIFLVVMFGLSIGGCEVLNSPPPAAVEISFGKVLFDCYYVNFAWGYTLSGYYIDQEGGVIRYDRGDDPWQPESLQTEPFVFSSADLEMKFKNQSRVGEVASDLLQEKLALAGRAAAGEISQEQVAADAGWSGCVLYHYHPDLDGYSEIPLGAGGDFLIRNSAPEARELLGWLQGLDTAP